MKGSVVLGVTLALVVGLALSALFVHSRTQLQLLRDQAMYASPEEGMRALVGEWYTGLQKVEIVHAGADLPLLDNLYFVEARVWADDRIDGKMKYPDGDNPGCFFLRLDGGWVMVPEGRRPYLVAIGARLCRAATLG